jgi:hypothetical protein
MTRILDAMDAGEDVGGYGRLTFVIVARHFLQEEEMLALLKKQPGVSEPEARALLKQVSVRDYNPPKRERLLQWQNQQEFKFCPNPDDPDACNLYRELQFPDEVYDNIEDFWEEKVEADES